MSESTSKPKSVAYSAAHLNENSYAQQLDVLQLHVHQCVKMARGCVDPRIRHNYLLVLH